MKHKRVTTLAALCLVVAAAPALAATHVRADLKSYEEVPAISVPAATGHFEGTLNGAKTELTYTLTLKNFESTLTQSLTRSGRTRPLGAVQTRQITVITISCTVAMPNACCGSDQAPSPTMCSA